jgi:hypothetical protein
LNRAATVSPASKRCACHHIWRVLFYNSMGAPIQEIIEIAAIPSGAAATAEDVQDDGNRLLSILEIYA